MCAVKRFSHEKVLEELGEIPFNEDALKILAVFVEAAPRCNRPLLNLSRSVMLREVGVKVGESIRKAPPSTRESYCSCHKLATRSNNLYYIDTFYAEGKIRREIFKV